MFKNKTILVTGSEGFVGRHLIEYLRHEEGITILGMDLKIGMDILTEELPDKDKVDYVFHLAAQTDYFCKDATYDAQNNIMGSLRLFEKYGEKLVFASSSMVNYPQAPYAISKQACEAYALYFGCKVVRFCNLFGNGGHSVMDKFREAEDKVLIYGTGEQKRTFAPVRKAIKALMQSFEAGAKQLTVLEGEEMTVLEVADIYQEKEKVFMPACDMDIAYATQKT